MTKEDALERIVYAIAVAKALGNNEPVWVPVEVAEIAVEALKIECNRQGE